MQAWRPLPSPVWEKPGAQSTVHVATPLQTRLTSQAPVQLTWQRLTLLHSTAQFPSQVVSQSAVLSQRTSLSEPTLTEHSLTLKQS